jgi:DNA/RNA endonuclease G (NUC1)
MNLSRCQALVAELEREPDRVPAYYGDLEGLIAECMNEVYRLSKTGTPDNRKLRLVAIEYRARLLLERCRKQGANYSVVISRSLARRGVMSVRDRIANVHWHIGLSLVAVLGGVWTPSVYASELKPIVLDKNYSHDLFGTMPRDIVRHFRAYTTSFDGPDDNNGDGTPDKWGIPEWVAYEIKALPEGTTLGAAPDSPKWMTETALFAQRIAPSTDTYHFTEQWRETYPDSEKLGYSRGHMCMKQHAWRLGADAVHNTHTVLNACPQRQVLNGGIWLDLEYQTAAWADKYGSVWIIAGPVVFNGKPSKWLGQAGEVPAAIPDAFFKIVVKLGDDGEPDVLAFLYPQEWVSGDGEYNHTPYLTSVDIIEALTGLDFLTNVPDDVEAKIEAVVHTKLWD